jgi:hypothetical protein
MTLPARISLVPLATSNSPTKPTPPTGFCVQ